MKSDVFMAGLAATLATFAALASDTPGRLGEDLTRFGAIKAGNADGTIPPYEGGVITIPAGLQGEGGRWPNPFAGERPRLRITAQNADQYADKLSEAQLRLLKDNPDSYYMDIYPTHRTVIYPEEFLAATERNATNPDCRTEEDGLALSEACRGGLPFPLPQDGYQVMWNYLLNFDGVNGWEYLHSNYVVSPGGARTLTSRTASGAEKPFYQVGVEGRDTGQAVRLWSRTQAPARQAGRAAGYWDYLNPVAQDRYAWSYETGQRRVRQSPEFAYDTPSTSFGGLSFYDEINLFSGKMDRFDFKLLGKKEMYLPYSSYDLKWHCDAEESLQARHINPKCERWELHRVWVVEASLKQGKRHADSRRRYYIDEDTYGAALYVSWDQSGGLHRAGFRYTYQLYGQPNLQLSDMYSLYDLTGSRYGIFGMGPTRYRERPVPDLELQPQSIAASQAR